MADNENTTQTQPLDLRAQLEAALLSEEAPAAPAAPAEAAPAPEAAQTPAPAEAEQAAAQPTETPAQQTPTPETPPAAPQESAQMTQAQANMYSALLNRSAEALRTMQEENARLNQMLQQQSQVAEQKAEEAAAQPTIPVLDMSQWGYLSDEQRAEKAAEYQNGMMAYFKNAMLQEIAPLKDAYEQQKAAAAREQAIAALSGDERMKGFKDDLPMIQNILDKTPELSGADPNRRYQIAYYINRGIQAQNAPQRSAAQIADEAMSNPEVMRILETRRATETAQKNAEVPVVAASAGMSSAAAIPTNRPKTIEEAHRMLENFSF